MSDYTKLTNFAAKDSLPSGNAAKRVLGTEIDAEFSAISTAVATKADKISPSFTGDVTVTGELVVQSPVYVRARRTSTDQTSGAVPIFNTEDFDTDSAYNNATGQFTAPSAGYYSVQINALIENTTGGPALVAAQITVNGSIPEYYGYTNVDIPNTGIANVDLNCIIKVNAGDVIAGLFTTFSGTLSLLPQSGLTILRLF